MLPLGKVVGIMEVNDAFLVSTNYFLWQQKTHGQIFADFAGHVISLCGVDDRIFVGIFLFHFLVHPVDQGQDSVIRGVGFSGQLPFETIADVLLSHFIAAHFHNPFFYHILNIFNIGSMGKFQKLFLNGIGNGVNLIGI